MSRVAFLVLLVYKIALVELKLFSTTILIGLSGTVDSPKAEQNTVPGESVVTVREALVLCIFDTSILVMAAGGYGNVKSTIKACRQTFEP